jgi:hypothetical protein
MSTTEPQPEPEGPGIETEKSAEVTTEGGTEITHAEQTGVQVPSEEAAEEEAEEDESS